MKFPRPHRLRDLVTAFAAGIVGVLMLSGATLGATASPDAQEQAAPQTDRPERSAGKPTIVLVHGAFADSSGWNTVARRLLDAGYPVLAFSNPLRGPLADSAYLRDFLNTVEGPVVLVGHSYGGAVITNAATGNPTSSPWSTSPPTPPTRGRASRPPTPWAVDTPRSPTTS